MGLGLVYKFHRESRGARLRQVAQQYGIAFSKLSTMEHDKAKISEDDLMDLYALIGIDASFPENASILCEQRVWELFHCISYVTKKDEHYLEELRKIKKYLID